MKFHKDGALPECKNAIFVFGSNLMGMHGGGAAREANINFGAIWGKGIGRHGESYAIPTKENFEKALKLDDIRQFVNNFIEYAKRFSNEEFFITRIGCGLAGFENKDIAPMFKDCPDNCSLPDSWKEYLDGTL
jgi:hypothetical protein